MPFNVSLKSFVLFSHTSGGMARCILICSFDIHTSYLNFIFASALFYSLITRVSFMTFSDGDSSSQTFTSATMLQVYSMDFSNCYCHYRASSLCLTNYSNSFFGIYFSISTCIIDIKVCFSSSSTLAFKL